MLRFTKIAPVAVALALGTVALPAGAFAQSAAPQAQTQAQERPSRIEGRIAFLRTELKITDAQAPLWEKVAAVLRENDKARRDAFTAMRGSSDQRPTALERLERREKMAEQQAASTAKLREALEPLYAAMTDEQKKDADQLLGGGRHKGRMGHRRI